MLSILNPTPRGKSFGDSEVMFVLETLDRNLRSGRITGRGDISLQTGIGEGTVRTILQRLEPMGFLHTSRAGVTLSTTGTDFMKAVGISLLDLAHTDSAIGLYQVAILLRGKAEKIEKGVEQRNSGLKAGGDGCTTIICRGGMLILPPEWVVDENSPELASCIRSYGISDGDIVLIGGSNTSRLKAAIAVNSAALELL